ncbi:MAG: hypothetical protein LC800_06590 [Acidobacteria bacterium]|nr:hypothetical protein [Acidobacteriota bacterium]
MNPFARLTKPLLPSAALGLTGESAAVVSLDRRRDVLAVRSAGIVALPEGLIRPGFDESNVSDPAELADALRALVTSAGLARRSRWSIALPEAATRTAILTLEGASSSRGEALEMLRWKTERTFGASPDELRVARFGLRADAQGRARYLASAVRLSVLAEYESALAALGWHTGLILPRHFGEGWWLARGERAAGADSLLVSSHGEGFTASLLRAGQPVLVRSVTCDPEDRADELYRFLLFYRDRLQPAAGDDDAGPNLSQMLVAGHGLTEQTAAAIIEETLDARPHALRAADVRLSLPSPDLDFAHIAAPAGLAALAFG